MDEKLQKGILIGTVLGIVLYALFAFFADVDELLRAGAEFPWIWFPVVLMLASGNYLFRFMRWHLYLRNRGLEITLATSSKVFISGLAMSVTPGKFGELLKAQYLKNIDGTPRRVTAPVIITERLTDLLGVLIIASFGVFRFSYGEVVFFMVLAVIIASVFIISHRRLCIWFIKKLRPLPVAGPRVPKLIEAYENVSALLRPGLLSAATLISVVAWSCEAFAFYLVLSLLPGVEIGIGTAFFIYAFAILVGAVSMLPGGLGATEGTMAGLLLLLDIAKAQAVVATLITRLGTLWFAVLIGIVATGLWRRLLGATLQGSPQTSVADESNQPARML